MQQLLIIIFLILTYSCKTGVIQKKRYYNNGSLMACFSVLRSDTTKLINHYKSFYPDGQLSSEINFKNGLEHGHSKSYYPTGNLFAEYYKKDGMYHGDFKEYYQTGNIYYHIEYKNGHLWNIKGILDKNGYSLYPGTLQNGTGLVKKYDKDGNLILEGVLKNGKKEGYWKSFISSGFVDSIYYENGLRDGIVKDILEY